ncbi:MAG: putative metal-binding motif-containing protein [Pseudomonadota bacterium]
MALHALSRLLIFSLLTSTLAVGCSRDRDDDGYKSGMGEGFDCDDEDPDVNPGATEVCDGVDNNCDTVIDESTAQGAPTWYYDGDGDGFGDDDVSEAACPNSDGVGPLNFVSQGGDCDDSNPYLNPETLWYADTDDDGFGDPASSSASCLQPSGYVADDTDCDDTRDDVNPDEEEQCDDVDHNCNGDTGMVDTDLDGWAECEGRLRRHHRDGLPGRRRVLQRDRRRLRRRGR